MITNKQGAIRIKHNGGSVFRCLSFADRPTETVEIQGERIGYSHLFTIRTTLANGKKVERFELGNRLYVGNRRVV